MKYTGYGTGRTQAEAEANARADAQSQKNTAEMIESGGTLLQMLIAAAMGYVLAASLMYCQFLIRPIATLLLATIALLTFAAFILFLNLMIHLDWWVIQAFCILAIMGLVLWGGVFLMQSRNEMIENLDAIEAWERRMLCRAPGWIRVPLVTLETLMPIIALVTITVLYFSSDHFAYEGTRFLWLYIVIAVVTVLTQIVSLGKRGEASKEHGDFSVFGFRLDRR